MPTVSETYSLIYPQGYCYDDRDIVRSESNELIRRLGADWLFYHKTVRITDYLTSNGEVISYRRDTLREVMGHPGLLELIRGAVERLEQIGALVRVKENPGISYEAQFYSIRELEVYLDLVKFMAEGFDKLDAKGILLKSQGLLALRESVRARVPSSEKLRQGVEHMTTSIRNIKSVTVAFNLDSEMAPYEAGLLSINTEPVRSGELIDRLLNFELAKGDMTALAPMTAVSKRLTPREKSSVDMVFMSAMKKVYSGLLRSWAPSVKQYMASGGCEWLRLLPELQFLCAAADMIQSLKVCGLPLCWADITPTEEKRFSVKGLYNPAMAMKLKDSDSPVSISRRMVYNDIDFDDKGRIFILTGPNSGGKSVFTCGVGIAQVMFQLGLPVPAQAAVISPVKGIFTHFAQDIKGSTEDGRLGSECQRMKEIFRKLTPHSLVLLDETFSGTSSYEGAYLAADTIGALAALGTHAIYCTHMHELTARIPEINQNPQTRSRVDTLVAGSGLGDIRFSITRRPPDGKSYASRIAEKYGLSYDSLLQGKI
ncbi:MAG: hypothetical protein E7661_06510 [Ruminococcaceae bacterium]|nr:hypothetical protein [Oscillospiraceae bacterium]